MYLFFISIEVAFPGGQIHMHGILATGLGRKARPNVNLAIFAPGDEDAVLEVVNELM